MIEIISNVSPIKAAKLKVIENPIGHLAFGIRVDDNNLISIDTPVTSVVRLANIDVGKRVSNSGVFYRY
jgi:hypothetical protein